jgi:hypothetical protein
MESEPYILQIATESLPGPAGRQSYLEYFFLLSPSLVLILRYSNLSLISSD